MLQTLEHVISSIGGNTGNLAKRAAGSASDLAKRVAEPTANLARRVGPKRGIVGLVVLAAAVGGGIYVVRRLRARAKDQDNNVDAIARAPRATNKQSRAKRKANNLNAAH